MTHAPRVTQLHPASAHVVGKCDVLFRVWLRRQRGLQRPIPGASEHRLFPRSGRGGMESLLLGAWEVTPPQHPCVAWKPSPATAAVLQGAPAFCARFGPQWCARLQPRFSWEQARQGRCGFLPGGDGERRPGQLRPRSVCSAVWRGPVPAASAGVLGAQGVSGTSSESPPSLFV